MRKFSENILLLLLLLSWSPIYSQVSYGQFREQSDLNIKSEMGLELWNYYNRVNLDSLKIAAIDLLLVASEKEHEFARAVGTRMLGSYLYQSGKIQQGLEYMNVSRDYFEKKEDFVIASEIWNEIGHAHLLDGSYGKAKDAYNRSLRFGEQSTDATAAFNAKLGLGRAYIAVGDTNAGMSILHSYKQKSLESEKYEAAADVFAYMAMIENALGNKLLSDEYFMRSISYSKQSLSKTHLAHSYANLGIRKFVAEEYDSSLYFFKQSLNLRLEMNSMRPILEAYYNLGFFYLERDSTDLSIENFETGRMLAEKYELWVDLRDFLSELIPIYESEGETDLVSEYKARQTEVKILLEEKMNSDDDLIDGINLDFAVGKTNELSLTDRGGVNWIYFTLIVLGGLLITFFVAERKRFN